MQLHRVNVLYEVWKLFVMSFSHRIQVHVTIHICDDNDQCPVFDANIPHAATVSEVQCVCVQDCACVSVHVCILGDTYM